MLEILGDMAPLAPVGYVCEADWSRK